MSDKNSVEYNNLCIRFVSVFKKFLLLKNTPFFTLRCINSTFVTALIVAIFLPHAHNKTVYNYTKNSECMYCDKHEGNEKFMFEFMREKVVM